MPTWFITGCSIRLGRELGRPVLTQGWNTVATARDPAALTGLFAGDGRNRNSTREETAIGADYPDQR
jgi:hypothetical protein